jgi:hypothetical protein
VQPSRDHKPPSYRRVGEKRHDASVFFTRNAKTCRAVALREGGCETRNGLAGRRRWRGTRVRCWQFDVFQLAAEVLYLFLENLDLGFDFGIEVLASYVRQKKNASRADN